MNFFSLENRTLIVVLGILLIASWGFGIYQYGINHRWAALDFARSSAYEYDAPECQRWLDLGQASLNSFTQSACDPDNISSWSPQCRQQFSGFQENMENWVYNCSIDTERQLK